MPVASPEVYAQMLDRAKAGKFAYPAINCTSSQTIVAALRGFAEAQSDGIIQFSFGGAEFASGQGVKSMVGGAVALAEFAHSIADYYDVNIALHTDHCAKEKLEGFVEPLLKISQERVALGLALLEWSVSTRQGAALLSVGDGLRSLDMAPEQRTQRLKLLCNNLWMAKDKTRLAELEKELLPLKPGPGLSADEQADLWRALAASAVLMQDYPTGMRLAHAAMDHAPRHPHKVDYQAQQLLGVANVYQGKLPEAIEAMLAADRVGQALKLPDDPRLLHNFSGLFVYTKDWANVVAYGERALKALDDRSSITREIGRAHV